MTFDEVKDIIIDTLSFEGEEITPESDLINDLGIDSLDVVELMMALEEKFGITIPDEDVKNLHTVGQVAEYIDAHRN